MINMPILNEVKNLREDASHSHQFDVIASAGKTYTDEAKKSSARTGLRLRPV
jgi:hypothetical protein